MLFKDKQKFKVQYLGAGFWDHFNDIFLDPTKLYEGQDILFPGAKSTYEDIVQTFHKSLKKASKRIPNNTFADLHRNDHIWNMYAIPLEASSVKNIRTNVLKFAKTDLKTNVKMVDKCLVTKGVFLSVNFIMKAKKAPRSDKDPRKALYSSFTRGNNSIKRKVSADFADLKSDRKSRKNGVSFEKPMYTNFLLRHINFNIEGVRALITRRIMKVSKTAFLLMMSMRKKNRLKPRVQMNFYRYRNMLISLWI